MIWRTQEIHILWVLSNKMAYANWQSHTLHLEILKAWRVADIVTRPEFWFRLLYFHNTVEPGYNSPSYNSYPLYNSQNPRNGIIPSLLCIKKTCVIILTWERKPVIIRLNSMKLYLKRLVFFNKKVKSTQYTGTYKAVCSEMDTANWNLVSFTNINNPYCDYCLFEKCIGFPN